MQTLHRMRKFFHAEKDVSRHVMGTSASVSLNGCEDIDEECGPELDLPDTSIRDACSDHNTLYDGLCCLALEAVFPAFAQLLLDDYRVDSNKSIVYLIESGNSFFQEAGQHQLTSGSSAEGLALEIDWGQEESDTDSMVLRGGGWAVHVTPPGREGIMGKLRAWLQERQGYLLIERSGSSAYSRVKMVGNQDRLRHRMAQGAWRVGEAKVKNCLVDIHGGTYLSSYQTIRCLQYIDQEHEWMVHGPAHAVTETLEFIPGLICVGPLPSMAPYIARQRNTPWPRAETRERIARMPALLVAIGHKSSTDVDIEFRDSWSIPEMLLANDMPRWVKQGYRAFKYVVKNNIHTAREKHKLCIEEDAYEGRAKIGSFHMKTTLLWALETPTVWESQCPFNFFLCLVTKFNSYLQPSRDIPHKCRQPHYFLPNCNLFELVSEDELELARQCLHTILEDPLTSIIRGVRYPEQVYADQHAQAVQAREELLDALATLAKYNDQSSFPSYYGRAKCNLEILDKQRLNRYWAQYQNDHKKFESKTRTSYFPSTVALFEDLCETFCKPYDIKK